MYITNSNKKILQELNHLLAVVCTLFILQHGNTIPHTQYNHNHIDQISEMSLIQLWLFIHSLQPIIVNMSSLHQDLPFDRHHLLMLKVASGELVNEISVLLTSLTDNNREHHIFPKHICQRILLKINSILRPSLDAIHSHHTYPMTGSYMDKPTLKVLTATHNLRQNLIIIKGNMETVENQFYTDTLLSMVLQILNTHRKIPL